MGLRIEQGFQYQGEDWWKWWIWLDGTQEELASVQEVTYVLHPSFPNPVRTIRNRETKFRLETAGWGTFTIYARVLHADDTVSNMEHELVLLYDDGKPTMA
jgi:transcription initiation factor IIF auxiliary subunit